MSCLVLVFPVYMSTLLRQRRLRWLGHVRRMEDGRIPKDILYYDLALGKRPTGRHQLRYKDGSIRHFNMKAIDIDTMSWEGIAADRTTWRSALKQHVKTGEDKLMTAAADKRARRKEGSSSIRPETAHICVTCNKDCHSHIGLFSHISDDATTKQGINTIKTKALGCIIHGHL